LFYASMVLWLCLILVCISVLLAVFSIPIVVRVFGLSVPNLLKPSRSNGVKNVSVFHLLYLVI
ncbi:hypothetical protein, partial [Aliivibrio sp. 1S165]|uniref:hypothetical protein n=1 Tax=Aliivibrio sp. 1S165 TaxID=1840086 RepID=UPI001C4003C4